MTPETWVLIGVTALNGLKAVDDWVHRQERRQAELTAQTTGQPSLQSQIDEMESLRTERAEILNQRLAAMQAQIDGLHKKASDEGDRQQANIGRVERRLARIEAQIEELYRALDRRLKNRPSPMDGGDGD